MFLSKILQSYRYIHLCNRKAFVSESVTVVNNYKFLLVAKFKFHYILKCFLP